MRWVVLILSELASPLLLYDFVLFMGILIQFWMTVILRRYWCWYWEESWSLNLMQNVCLSRGKGGRAGNSASLQWVVNSEKWFEYITDYSLPCGVSVTVELHHFLSVKFLVLLKCSQLLRGKPLVKFLSSWYPGWIPRLGWRNLL